MSSALLNLKIQVERVLTLMAVASLSSYDEISFACQRLLEEGESEDDWSPMMNKDERGYSFPAGVVFTDHQSASRVIANFGCRGLRAEEIYDETYRVVCQRLGYPLAGRLQGERYSAWILPMQMSEKLFRRESEPRKLASEIAMEKFGSGLNLSSLRFVVLREGQDGAGLQAWELEQSRGSSLELFIEAEPPALSSGMR